MSTAAQITANRVNAQQSTGPRSVDGKTISSRNALKLGIHAQSLVIPGEDAAALEELTRQYEADLRPDGPVESALVQTLIRADWMLRRMARIEAEVLGQQISALESPGAHPLGEIYLNDANGAKVLQSIARRQHALQREYVQTLKLLRELKQARFEASVFQSVGRAKPLNPTVAALEPENRVRFSPPPSPHPLGNPALRL